MAHLHYYLHGAEAEKKIYRDTQIIYTGRVSNLPDWSNEAHQHDFCEILYVTNGSMRFISNGYLYFAEKGDLILCNPHMMHEEQACSDEMLLLHFFAVKGFTFPNLLKDHILPVGANPIVRCGAYAKQMEERFDELLVETQRNRSYSEPIAQGLAVAILSHAMRLYESRKQQETPKEKAILLCRYIDEHYNQALTLDSLAQEFKISKYYLCALFKQEMDISPIKYLNMRRIEKACDLLTTSLLSINDIAGMVGYADVQYFRRKFRVVVGIPPGKFRKQHS